ncbi:hypothetical protein JCM3770_002781 [Rhodotorula araucariae]
MASYGASLPDSVPLVHARAGTHLALLPTFASFLQSLTQQQRDSSAKASSLIGSFRLSVARSAADRGGDAASLERALSGVLEQCDLQARELGEQADRVHREVAARMDEVGRRLGDVLKKHHTFYGKLMAQRDKAYETRDRARSNYFSACDALESARARKASAKEGRDRDKAARAYDGAYEDMLLAKDQYLVDLDVANMAKQRVYSVHLPNLHDEFQVLEQSAVRQLEDLLARMVAIQRQSGERTRACVQKAQDALQLVDVEADQRAFVDTHSTTLLAAYEHPPDLVFEESPVWHDTDAFDTSPPAVTYLQNLKLKAEAKLADISPAVEAKRREISGLKNLREAYERDRGLGDTVSVVENLFNVSHETTLLELQQSELRASVELIDATLGEDASTGLRPHEFKHSSFVTPQTCAVCESSVWGKGLSCKKCSMAVHAKCELKVPAGCTARPGAGVVRAKSKRGGASGAGSPAMASTTSLARTTSSASASSSSASLPPLRRAVPPPAGAISPSPSSAPLPSSPAHAQRATVLYAYSAASPYELPLTDNEVGSAVDVVDAEDDNGWVKVRAADGRVGLVPASYVEIGGSGAVGVFPEEDAADRTAAGRVVALYDYAPQSTDEVALQEGGELCLTETGYGAGEGWAEVFKDGRTGLVPAAYIQAI